ncbi:hypothetical protein CRG98_035188 [Punica granatum]|uniref:Uncharacterized protein n=1 Tax=Punica granatum TaxID=22663 RepID=A0A2I0IM73_PUNGR|nr:hypothetical protein CRG98_035188 [Punica granatum]
MVRVPWLLLVVFLMCSSPAAVSLLPLLLALPPPQASPATAPAQPTQDWTKDLELNAHRIIKPQPEIELVED